MEDKTKPRWKLPVSGSFNLLQENAIRMRKNPTDAERILWNVLRLKEIGVKFRRQYIIGEYIVDFVNLGSGLIVEVDGKYHFNEEQKKFDKERTEYLENKGFTVIRFANEEIYKNIDMVISQISQKLSELTSSGTSSPSSRGEGRGGDSSGVSSPSPRGEGQGGDSSPLRGDRGGILITGGAGFIGSHVVRRFVRRYPDTRIINVDALTYAGNLENLRDIEDAPNYTFIRADICDFERMKAIMTRYGVTGVIHLAAESHVDRSIRDPFTFARTNVLGTLTLLEAARQTWLAPSPSKRQRSTSEALHQPEGRSTSEALHQAPGRSKNLFYHISTDEVYGSLPLPPGGGPGWGSSPSPLGEGRGGASGASRGGAPYKLASPDVYPLLKEKAREMRKNMTDGEKAMWNLLQDKSLGVKFRRQHIIGDYIVDFVDLNNRLVIEVDGKYHDDPDQQNYDENRTEFLKRQGLTVIRFRNEEVIGDPHAVKSKIKSLLSSSPLPLWGGPGWGSSPSHSGEGRGGAFTESTAYSPHSPYSASKASSDHFVRAYHDTYGLPTIVTNCSNNYGPYQFPEKLIPLFINNIRLGKPLPVYGKGENVRDWLYVEDHARAIDLIFHEGKPGETYNIGGFNEWRNIDLIRVIIKTVDRLLGRPEGHSDHLITYVTDRPGHDLRYAIDSSKLHRELGWSPSLQFEEGIEKTVRWYLDHPEWSDRILSGDYRRYYEEMYSNR